MAEFDCHLVVKHEQVVVNRHTKTGKQGLGSSSTFCSSSALVTEQTSFCQLAMRRFTHSAIYQCPEENTYRSGRLKEIGKVIFEKARQGPAVEGYDREEGEGVIQGQSDPPWGI